MQLFQSLHKGARCSCGAHMGKKAYLFCQNDLSCSHAAEMYSFFGACKVLGKNPEHWLTYALKHMNTWPKDRLEELLPENWTDDTI